MADKKTSKKQIGNALAPLKAKADMVDRLAKIMGCEPEALVEALELMQGHVQAIRNLVEPEVVDDHPASLPEACSALVNRYHWARERLDGAEARIAELEAELATCRAATVPDVPGPLDVSTTVYRDALADFGLSVLAGRVEVSFRAAP